LLGIDSACIVDSRTTQVHFEYCVLANTGHWFYPNKADIDALRKYILPKLPPPTGKLNRVYISRAGRRRVLNESELLDLLRRYDIEVIEDKPRSVAEQVAIYPKTLSLSFGPTRGPRFVNISLVPTRVRICSSCLLQLISPISTEICRSNSAYAIPLTFTARQEQEAGLKA